MVRGRQKGRICEDVGVCYHCLSKDAGSETDARGLNPGKG